MAGLDKELKELLNKQITVTKSAVSAVQDEIYGLEDELKDTATSDDRIDEITYDSLPNLDGKRAELNAELNTLNIQKDYFGLRRLTLIGGAVAAASIINLSVVLGVVAQKEKDYLKVADTQSIAKISATYVTPVPGPQGSSGAQGLKGEQGIQGLVGPQGATGPQGAYGSQGSKGEQGIQGLVGPPGAPGQKPTAKDIETAVNEYFKANPPSIPTTVPTKQAPAPTPAAPAATPAPKPYELPSRFEVSYSAAQAMFSRDPAGFSEASGIKQAAWRIILNGKDSNESELNKLVLIDGKYTVYFTNSGKAYTADRSGSAKTLETYLKTQTTPEERKLITPLK